MLLLYMQRAYVCLSLITYILKVHTIICEVFVAVIIFFKILPADTHVALVLTAD